MPPRLLLDAHVSAAVAQTLAARGYDVVASDRDARLRRLSDESLLVVACREQRAIVTYNVRHFEPLARTWAMAGRHHWGIILIHSRTIAQHDVGGQLRALEALLATIPDEDGLRDQTVYLAPARP